MKRSIWHDDYIKLRDLLKSMRLEQGLTQVQLAKKLDKPQSFVAKYECGDRNLDFIEVIKVCECCDTDIQTLLKQLGN